MPSSADRTPVVLYKNLDLFNSCFVAGSVATKAGGKEECVQGATVELSDQGQITAREITDAFGEFWFSSLPKNKGPYTLKVIRRDRAEIEKQVDPATCCSTGTLWI